MDLLQHAFGVVCLVGVLFGAATDHHPEDVLSTINRNHTQSLSPFLISRNILAFLEFASPLQRLTLLITFLALFKLGSIYHYYIFLLIQNIVHELILVEIANPLVLIDSPDLQRRKHFILVSDALAIQPRERVVKLKEIKASLDCIDGALQLALHFLMGQE